MKAPNRLKVIEREKQRKSTEWWKGCWEVGDYFSLKRNTVYAPQSTPGKIIKILCEPGSKNFQYLVQFPETAPTYENQKRFYIDGPTLEDMSILLEDDFHFKNYATIE